MLIALRANTLDTERPTFTTTSLALAALSRGHDVFYVTPGDFILRPDDALMLRAANFTEARPKKAGDASARSDGTGARTHPRQR